MFGLGRDRNPSGPLIEVAEDETVPVIELAHEPVTHVEQYLSYYVSRLEPGYAVLVTGGWGAGKTHQVRAALPETHAYYVSLFGLGTPEEIEAQIFAAMYPKKAAFRKLIEKADGVNVEIPLLGGLSTGGLGSALGGVFIKNTVDAGKPLILDDLERSSVDIKTLLGVINRYVEHHKCRVIVIAHDGKLANDFLDSKEKIFGQTLRVKPNIEAAFSAFTTEFSPKGEVDKAQKVKADILSVFKESGTDSLRILRHVVEDVERLIGTLELRHLNNELAMVELVRLFSALAIEVRSGGLNQDDLMKRSERIQFHKYSGPPAIGEQPPRIVVVADKYKSVNIGSAILHDHVLIETLIDGLFVGENIVRSINSSVYFMQEEKAAPWQIVGSFDRLEDDIVIEALRTMERQFAQREILESGELLHVVSLKMMMASRRLTNETVADVRDLSISYIDDLLEAGILPERSFERDWTDSFGGSFDSVQYWILEKYKDEFAQVFEHLVKARGAALDRRLPVLAQALLDVVRTDGKKFLEKICYTRNGQIEYEDVPILANILPADFVNAWLALPKTEWHWVTNALKERRKVIRGNSSLLPEDHWYPKVQRELLVRARKEASLARLRLVRAAQHIGVPMRAVRKCGKRAYGARKHPFFVRAWWA